MNSTNTRRNKLWSMGRKKNKTCKNGLYHDMNGMIYVGGERIHVMKVMKGYAKYFTNWPFEMNQTNLQIREM